MDTTRRWLLLAASTVGLGGAWALVQADGDNGGEKKPSRDKSGKKGQEGKEEDVSAPEDLMREHGVLNRILLIYEEGLRRLRANNLDGLAESFRSSAQLVRSFVEDYHERLEERFIFPEFEQRKRLTELVEVLRRQHRAGRTLTDVVLRTATNDRIRQRESQTELVRSCETFIRMYRPHEAREDTVLFPALREIVTARRVRELGEQFEEEEHRLFGDEGFHRIVEQVAAAERRLGIHDLDQFTPRTEQR